MSPVFLSRLSLFTSQELLMDPLLAHSNFPRSSSDLFYPKEGSDEQIVGIIANIARQTFETPSSPQRVPIDSIHCSKTKTLLNQQAPSPERKTPVFDQQVKIFEPKKFEYPQWLENGLKWFDKEWRGILGKISWGWSFLGLVAGAQLLVIGAIPLVVWIIRCLLVPHRVEVKVVIEGKQSVNIEKDTVLTTKQPSNPTVQGCFV